MFEYSCIHEWANIHKFINNQLCNIIIKLFNGSIQSGIFPDCNKFAKILPIHKSGNNTTSISYRPISLQPILSKNVEKLMHHRFNTFVKRNNLKRNNKYGSRKYHKTTTDVVLKFLDHEQLWQRVVYFHVESNGIVTKHKIALKKSCTAPGDSAVLSRQARRVFSRGLPPLRH